MEPPSVFPPDRYACRVFDITSRPRRPNQDPATVMPTDDLEAWLNRMAVDGWRLDFVDMSAAHVLAIMSSPETAGD